MASEHSDMAEEGAVLEASEEGRAGVEGAEGAKGGDDCSVSSDGERHGVWDWLWVHTVIPNSSREGRDVVEAILLSIKLYHAFK